MNVILLWALAFGAVLSILGRTVYARALPDAEAASLFRELEMSRGSVGPASLQEMQSTLGGAQAALLVFEETARESLRVLRLTATRAEAITLERGSFYAAALEMTREVLSEDSVRRAGSSLPDSSSARSPATRSNPVLPGDGPGLGSVRCGQMLGPILETPLSGVERLYIAQPSALDACPFEILSLWTAEPTPAGRLGNALAISYVPNGSCLIGLSPPRLWSGAALVAFTEPAVSPSASSARAVRGAAAAIGVSRGKPHMYKGSAATVAALRSVATVKPVVLHLDLIARSDGIAFDHGDGAKDLAGSGDVIDALPLEGLRHLGLTTDLTLVSQTVASPGSIHRVPEALLAGGSRSVIVPRWPVDPRTAEMFLDHFYEGLLDALPRDKAMHKARVALAANGAALSDQLAFAHWGAGNLPVYLIATKGNPFPLLVAWLLFLPPVIASIVWLRRRHLRRLRESSRSRG